MQDMRPRRRRERRRDGTGQAAGGTIRGFIEPVLLLLLHRGASHGYELVGGLESFGLGDVPTGPVYRTLRSLEAAGFVESEWDTESSSGPARRVYQVTQAGRVRLDGWAEDLRRTDRALHHFLAAFDEHMKGGFAD